MDDGQLPAGRTLLTRMVALMVRPPDSSVIPHIEEDRRRRVEAESMPESSPV
jgi:hypothetical protein